MFGAAGKVSDIGLSFRRNQSEEPLGHFARP
jgi:hypothetical protein